MFSISCKYDDVCCSDLLHEVNICKYCSSLYTVQMHQLQLTYKVVFHPHLVHNGIIKETLKWHGHSCLLPVKMYLGR